MIIDDITQAVGGTPLLRLSRFAPDARAELFAKLEFLNPYSIKDRPVLYMIRAAEEQGLLEPGGTIVEATSGNTGMAAAMVAAVRGYTCVLVMSEIQSVERRQVLLALGARLELTPRAGGTKAARKRAQEIAAETGAFYLGQHDHPANVQAHAETTAEELWTDTEGRIDAFVAGLGTAGTLVGVSKALKARKPEVRVIGVEPEESPFISQGIFRPHRMMGTAPGFVPGILERDRIDDILLVSEAEAFAACRRIAHTEGVLAGISSGASAAAALRLAQDPAWAGKTIVCTFCDSGQRYLSVDGLFDSSSP